MKIITARPHRLLDRCIDIIGQAVAEGKRCMFLVPSQYTLQAEMLYDWYDVEFLNEFSRIVSHSGEKDILYLYEGYQMVHVFYGDSDWARQFRNMTGYSLSTEITYY